MKRFLFQGDSITDARRDRENVHSINTGYVHLVSSKLLSEFPGEFEFFNRGIGGNRIIDVYARVKSDIINLKPDYMSILIGVNDVWHHAGDKSWIPNEVFYARYRTVLAGLSL